MSWFNSGEDWFTLLIKTEPDFFLLLCVQFGFSFFSLPIIFLSVLPPLCLRFLWCNWQFWPLHVPERSQFTCCEMARSMLAFDDGFLVSPQTWGSLQMLKQLASMKKKQTKSPTVAVGTLLRLLLIGYLIRFHRVFSRI